jgi:magnesium transporter
MNPEDKDLLYLKENFRFHPLDFEDVVTPSIRPKIDEYDEYHFIILLFPLLKKDSQEIKPTEVDFFVGKNFVVTVHDGTMKTLTNLVHNVHQYDNVRSQYMGQGSAGFLLFSILELLFKRSFPILDTISLNMDRAGKNLFEPDVESLQQLSYLKKNIIVYRRIMKMHKFVLSKLARSDRSYMKFPDSKMYFQNLIEYAENIWDVLASDKETVESYENTNQSLATHKMNDILRVLTIFSVIIFILTLIVDLAMFLNGIYSINDWPMVFPLLLSFLGIVTLGLLSFFRKRQWL